MGREGHAVSDDEWVQDRTVTPTANEWRAECHTGL